MEQCELLCHACATLEKLDINYLVTGSQATIVFGEPRFTNDIDIVVDLDLQRLDAFIAAFPQDDFYLSREAAREAIRARGMFNIIHPSSGLKIDVIIPNDTLFERSRFDRGHKVLITDSFSAMFAAPEDVILKKLEFHKIGGSDRHLRDIIGVLKISADKVDRDYVNQFADELGVADLWQAVLNRVDDRPATD
jgi:hypothetical protein